MSSDLKLDLLGLLAPLRRGGWVFKGSHYKEKYSDKHYN